jgi:hypothetical protein
MIYTFPDKTEPIRQGDIFIGIPRIDFSLEKIILYDAEQPREIQWEKLVTTNDSHVIMVAVRPVTAIVISQDCDTIRAEDISLCEIKKFDEVYTSKGKDVKGWVSILTQHARNNQKWFYLPQDSGVGFVERMAIDFQLTIRVPRIDLEKLIKLRKGRLNDVADEHFREKLSEFFRRYPYDEWYPLNDEELKCYQSNHEGTEPFPWQKGVTS